MAIDRAMRWVQIKISTTTSAEDARAFLKAVRVKAPFSIRRLLTANDKAVTDRLQRKQRAPSGEHVFDKLFAEAGIEHRLTLVRRPQTNGKMERFNGQISHVLASNRFYSRGAFEPTLQRYCDQ